MLLDYHIHSFLSDGTKDHKAYLETAIQNGIDEIGFTEHLNFNKVDWTMKISNLSNYVNIVKHLRKNAKIPVKLGIEIDFIPGFEKRIQKIIKAYPFDYVIGSVHLIGDWCFDDDRQLAEYKNWDIDKLYETYFDLVQRSAKARLFDVVGHADLVKKFNLRPSKDITNLFLETANIFKKENICIEVNTGGLTKPCKEMYPEERFLKTCFDKNVPITIGSDAHKPEDVGQFFNQAINLVKKIGYKKIVQFNKRERKFVEI